VQWFAMVYLVVSFVKNKHTLLPVVMTLTKQFLTWLIKPMFMVLLLAMA